MSNVVISGTGLFVPPEVITNDELVATFNEYVDIFNADNAEAIADGTVEALQYSSSEFIEKASGIRQRHVVERSGVLDPNIMKSQVDDSVFGDDDTPSMQAKWAIDAAEKALARAGKTGADVDYVICAAALQQRYFPAMAIEVQKFIGASGFAMDLTMACSSATFGMLTAYDALKAGSAKCVLVVNPEFFSTMTNYRDRDSHFIFGDVCTAVVMELEESCTSDDAWRVIGRKAMTQYSRNITSNLGPLMRLVEGGLDRADSYFLQEGRKVFKELLPIVISYIAEHLEDNDFTAEDMRRLWLHQANINMDKYAVKKLLGREPDHDVAPMPLTKYANMAGAGSIVAFHENKDDLVSGDKGIICSFGAGYSLGSLIVEKV